jgi:hypothetical protein
MEPWYEPHPAFPLDTTLQKLDLQKPVWPVWKMDLIGFSVVLEITLCRCSITIFLIFRAIASNIFMLLISQTSWAVVNCFTHCSSRFLLGQRPDRNIVHQFNIAVLAKQAWWLLANPESLCSQVLKAKYYPNGCCLQAVPKDVISFFLIGKDGISYIWRSILKGTDLLKDGVVDQSGKWKQLGYMGRSVATTELVSSMTDHPEGSTLLRRISELINKATVECGMKS